MTRLRIALAAVLVLAALATASRATGAPSCDISFKPATTGNWSVAANWDLGRAPRRRRGRLHPGRLDGHARPRGTVRPGAMSVAGTLVWSGGTISGAGTTTIEPGGRIDHTAVTALDEGRVLEVKGTLDLKTAGTFIDDRGVAPTAIVVAPGGVIRRTATGAGSSRSTPRCSTPARCAPTTARSSCAAGASRRRRATSGPVRGPPPARCASPRARGRWRRAPTCSATSRSPAPRSRVPQDVTVPAAGANRLASGTLAGTGTLDVTGSLELTGGRMTDARPDARRAGRHAGRQRHGLGHGRPQDRERGARRRRRRPHPVRRPPGAARAARQPARRDRAQDRRQRDGRARAAAAQRRDRREPRPAS